MYMTIMEFVNQIKLKSFQTPKDHPSFFNGTFTDLNAALRYEAMRILLVTLTGAVLML